MGQPMWKLAVPALVAFAFGALGVKRWLRDHALRLPQAAVASAADRAGVTVQQWRAVEAVQADIINGMALAVAGAPNIEGATG